MKTFKRILFSGMSLSLLLLLTGCVGRDKAGNPSGIIWDVLGRPMADSIQFFAKDSGLDYGLAIIIVTLIVRLIIFPLGIYQSWKATLQSEKMNYFKPIFAPIQERINNAETQEEKLEAQQELMAAQRENGLSMFGGIGCLPLLIQMPF
ncbi:YidC/Oxa1 family membrane protein insertase, partial [uncultured Streptococcus sp.]|uniref:YidC/Oxa1 family membrane protein insertase n=1 Tax=uncultured Streptococcus sp. TaxID=83427 RepID=UPI0028D0EABA